MFGQQQKILKRIPQHETTRGEIVSDYMYNRKLQNLMYTTVTTRMIDRSSLENETQYMKLFSAKSGPDIT